MSTARVICLCFRFFSSVVRCRGVQLVNAGAEVDIHPKPAESRICRKRFQGNGQICFHIYEKAERAMHHVQPETHINSDRDTEICKIMNHQAMQMQLKAHEAPLAHRRIKFTRKARRKQGMACTQASTTTEARGSINERHTDVNSHTLQMPERAQAIRQQTMPEVCPRYSRKWEKAGGENQSKQCGGVPRYSCPRCYCNCWRFCC